MKHNATCKNSVDFPLVSIITGTYNSGKYLKGYLRMLDLQTFKNFEVILVDDGSMDDTCEQIEALAAIDKRFNLIRKTPEGFPSRTRAVGLAAAKGEFVAFCDHDDFWAPQKLEFQLNVFNQFPNASIVHTDRFVWKNSMHPNEYFKFEGELADVPFHLQRPEEVIYQGLRIIFSSFIGRTDAVRKVGFHPEMKGVDDFYLFVRLAQMGAIYCVDLPLTYYFAHGANLSHAKNIFVEGFYKVYEALKSDGMPTHVLNSIHAQACRTEAVSLFASDRPRAFKLLIKSLKLYFIPSTLNRLLFLLFTFFVPISIQQKLFKAMKWIKFKFPTLRDLTRS